MHVSNIVSSKSTTISEGPWFNCQYPEGPEVFLVPRDPCPQAASPLTDAEDTL